MKEAIVNKIIKRLSGQRILNEIKLIFDEVSYPSTIRDISDLNVAKIKKEDLTLLSKLGSCRIYYYLSKLNINRIPLTTKERKTMKDLNKIKQITKSLENTSKMSTIYNILSPTSEELISIIPNLYPSLKGKIKIFSRLKKIKPFITGRELKKIGFKPGQRYKYLLKKMFDLQLNKNIKNRREAIRYLKNLKKGYG
jgi:hypothetical protein